MKVLKGIDLSFRESEFVAILGPSGSGKTTLLNVIGGLDHYDSGDLIIDNISTKGYSSRDWDSYRNHSIGFIFQSYNLIQHQSVLSNVEMALTISGISGKERRDMAARALEQVGLGAQLAKRPNQLSGGQMQRVAIARALVNDPKVVLADEPTGALDSKTSIQVMELLKEVARDRLIIMVTHNPELAHQYATRIITLKDGEIISDTDPYIPPDQPCETISANMGHASMNVFTALWLSFNNLWTKRSRTILTAFAGSIGIIGIALIAALSSGVDDYIYKQEANMAYQYPLLVETLNMNVSSMLSDLTGELTGAGTEHVEVIGFLDKLFAMLDTNDLEQLKAYLEQEEHDVSQYGTVEYVYNIQPQIYVEYGSSFKRVCPDSTLDSLGIPLSSIDTSLISSTVSTNMFSCMPQEQSLYLDRYDVKAGRWSMNSNECILVLTSEGKISDYLLYVLGMRDPGKVDSFIRSFISGSHVKTENLAGLSFEYDEFLGIQFKRVNRCDTYTYDSEYAVWRDRMDDTDYMGNLLADGDTLTIVGVVQPKKEYGLGVLKAGIAYPFSLIEKTIQDAAASDIVTAQLKSPDINIFTGTPFDENGTARELDPASMVNVDVDALKSAILIDQELLQSYFLAGADLDSMQITVPDMKLSSLIDIGEIGRVIRNQLLSDLPTLISDIQLSSQELTGLMEDILSDYTSYLKENGYLEIDQLADLLEAYFASDDFHAVINGWLQSIDPDNQDEGYLPGKIDELSDLILQSLNDYLQAQNVPGFPYLERTLKEYIATGRWEAIVQTRMEGILSLEQLEARLNDYVENTLRPLVEREIARSIQQLKGQIDELTASITNQVQAAVASSIKNGFAAVLSHAEECISLDTEQFLKAFSMKLGTKELSDILLSLTSFSKVTLSKNLQELGYVESSHPKSIQIYLHDFESKDAVIATLEQYNRQMELLGKSEDTISYTDTLGTVMSTVMRIITIITSALIATVAVSLVVSSIMIGVITYISVLERRKEIGILRAMGASKHNISQIFNAETFITGLISGCMGVGLGYALLIPLNAFLRRATQIHDIYAYLPGKYAMLLIIISVVLTTIGGIVPSKNASRSDPVEALRTE